MFGFLILLILILIICDCTLPRVVVFFYLIAFAALRLAKTNTIWIIFLLVGYHHVSGTVLKLAQCQHNTVTSGMSHSGADTLLEGLNRKHLESLKDPFSTESFYCFFYYYSFIYCFFIIVVIQKVPFEEM